ncbi:hypothetical protein [Nocardioides daphniae]|uniref:hypothetical protein n=1 Tax=Nocardioides daphniae TaxID=402297 RepID=UPI001315A8CB|nr:hypothetical protein [Nocardioides daphniae]
MQLLPNNATEQRTQLARRLAAKDSSTDLMNLDPIFVPEFASAGWLEPFTGELADRAIDDDVLEAPPPPPPGRTRSWWSRSGPTPRCSGTASRSPRRPGST